MSREDMKGHTAKFCLSVKDGEAKGEIAGAPAHLINLMVNIFIEQEEILSMVTAAVALSHKVKSGEDVSDFNIDDFML